jgi:hypothetical protein
MQGADVACCFLDSQRGARSTSSLRRARPTAPEKDEEAPARDARPDGPDLRLSERAPEVCGVEQGGRARLFFSRKGLPLGRARASDIARFNGRPPCMRARQGSSKAMLFTSAC